MERERHQDWRGWIERDATGGKWHWATGLGALEMELDDYSSAQWRLGAITAPASGAQSLTRKLESCSAEGDFFRLRIEQALNETLLKAERRAVGRVLHQLYPLCSRAVDGMAVASEVTRHNISSVRLRTGTTLAPGGQMRPDHDNHLLT
jgi:hypothetical protein